MMNQKGFTLIEALVTGMLVVILGGGLLAFISFSAGEARQGTSSSLLQMYAESIYDQAARLTRGGSFVLDQAAGETFANRTAYTIERTTGQVLIYDDAGTITGGLYLNAGVLQEFDTGAGTWIDYTAGSEVVTYASGSGFTVYDNRNSLGIDLTLVRTTNGIQDTMVLSGGRYLCRN